MNEPDGAYEQEADRIADAVLRMPGPTFGAAPSGGGLGPSTAAPAITSASVPSPPPSPSPSLQRVCAECEDELQRQVDEDDEEAMLQAKSDAPSGAGGATVPQGVAGQINSLRGGGQPLPNAARSFFEPRFGYDFSGVRVHTGGQAAGAAREVNARAFTVGSDVVFGAGEYAPGTEAGRRLLGHELVHTIQQSRAMGENQVLARKPDEPCPPECMVTPVPPGCPVSCDIEGTETEQSVSECPQLPDPHGEWASEPWLCEMRQEPPGSNRRLLAVGARGRSVELLHQVLQNWICDGHSEKRLSNSQSRVYDTSTREVVQAFQKWAGVAVDGIVGPRTLVEFDSFAGGPLTSSSCHETQQAARESAAESAVNDLTDAGISEEEWAEVGLLALGRQLQTVAAPEAQTLRTLYNEGIKRIELERARLQQASLPEQAIAKRLADMRHRLAIKVRQTGSNLMRKGAEAIDFVRGQSRPTYQSLRADGKTDAQIIKSATRSNKFINRLPKGLKWTGRALWFVQGGISVIVVVGTPPERQGEVIQKEVEGIVGGITGAAAFEGLCLAVGIATEGLGLIICGLLGGAIGYETARRGSLLELLDITPHQVPSLAGSLYRIEGDFEIIDLLIVSITTRKVLKSENVIVVATGKRSGQLISGRGHYRSLEVIPANQAAVELFEGKDVTFVPSYLLQPLTSEGLLRAGQ